MFKLQLDLERKKLNNIPENRFLLQPAKNTNVSPTNVLHLPTIVYNDESEMIFLAFPAEP